MYSHLVCCCRDFSVDILTSYHGCNRESFNINHVLIIAPGIRAQFPNSSTELDKGWSVCQQKDLFVKLEQLSLLHVTLHGLLSQYRKNIL